MKATQSTIWNRYGSARSLVASIVCEMHSFVLSNKAKLLLLEKILSQKPSIDFYVMCLYAIEHPCTCEEGLDSATLYASLSDKNRELVTHLIMSRSGSACGDLLDPVLVRFPIDHFNRK